MTRFGVMKHLRVLEDAGLVVTRTVGTGEAALPQPRARSGSCTTDGSTSSPSAACRRSPISSDNWRRTRHDEQRTSTTDTGTTTQIYRIFIRATPQAIWDAITTARVDAEASATACATTTSCARAARTAATRTRGCSRWACPEVTVDGEVIEADPPRKLVVTWRMVMDPRMAAEGFTRLTYEIEEGKGGVSRLSVIHDLDGTPGARGDGRGRPAGPGRRAVGGRGSSATSRRCWRAASR